MAGKTPRRRALLEALAETAAHLAHGQELLARSHQLMLDLVVTEDDDAPQQAGTHRRRPAIEAWRSYAGFREDMVQREREALRHNKPPIEKQQLASQTYGDSVRTITRTMQDYHLDPDKEWPPSTWPEKEPRGDIGDGHAIAALYCGVFAFGLLDYLSDGRFDLFVRFSKVVCRVLSGQV